MAGGALAVSPNAHADIVYSGQINLSINLNDNNGLFIDLDTGAFSNGTSIPGYDLNFFEATGSPLLQLRHVSDGVNGGLGFTSGNYSYVSRLGAGVTVNNAAGVFIPYAILATTQPSMNNSQFTGTSGGFVGFRFFSSTENEMLYGWARLDVAPDLENGYDGMVVARLVDYAFEDSGNSIVTGAIPEPSTMALGCLAAGAYGLKRWRDRRKARDVSS